MTKLLLASAVVVLALAPLRAIDVEGPEGAPAAPVPLPSAPADLNPALSVPGSILGAIPEAAPAGISVPQLTAVPGAEQPAALPAAGSAQAAAMPDQAQAAPQAAATAEAAQPQAEAAQAPLGSARAGQARTEEHVAAVGERVSRAAEAGEKAASAGDSAAAGRAIQDALTGEREASGAAPAPAPVGDATERLVRTRYDVLYSGREEMLNPGVLYREAYYTASLAAEKAGLPARVHLAEVTGSIPVQNGEHAKFTFYASGSKGADKIIYVDFKRSLTAPRGGFDARASVYTAPGTQTLKTWPELDDAAGYPYIERGFAAAPQTALDALRREEPSFGGAASFSARVEKDAKTGDVDVAYRFYDSRGNVGVVNARTLAISATMAKPPRPNPSARPAGPPKDSGLLAAVGAFAATIWFALSYGLSRDLTFSLEIAGSIGAFIAVMWLLDRFSSR